MAEFAGPLKTWVSGLVGSGVSTEYGDMPKTSPACMVKAETTDPVVKRYIDGGGVFRFSYGIYLRVRPLEGPDYELDALKVLGYVVSAIKGHEAPSVEGVRMYSHECTNAPALYMTEQDGGKIYQMTAEIQYYEKR